FFEDDFFDDDFFFGTLPPSARASDNPMAIACLRLVTFLPEPPLFNVPCLRSCIALSTLSEAFFPYFAMSNSSCTEVGASVEPARYDSRMRNTIVLLATLFIAIAASAASFDDSFVDKTMRVDYFHTSTPKGDEIIAIDGV